MRPDRVVLGDKRNRTRPCPLVLHDYHCHQSRSSAHLHGLGFLAICSVLYDLNYITDRTADLVALSGSNSEQNVRLNRSLFETFSHDMPIVFGAPLSSLLKLRKDEWESLRVYRDALREALRTVEDDQRVNAKVVFNDLVLPELNRIDLLFNRNTRFLMKAAARDVTFATGAVAIGLLTGFVAIQVDCGRTASCLTAPAQIPACGFPAPGSS